MSEPLVLVGENHWISPYVFTCFVTLKEKGIPFESEQVALEKHEQKQASYANASVTGRVPALRHGSFTLAESSAIVEYLDEVYKPRPALPTDIKERARARQVMAWIRSDDTLPLREERPTTTMFYEREKKPLSDKAQKCVNKVLEVAARLVNDKPSIFASWSVADADLAFLLQRLVINGHDVPPKLRSFAEAQWKRPSVREFVERKRPPYQDPY